MRIWRRPGPGPDQGSANSCDRNEPGPRKIALLAEPADSILDARPSIGRRTAGDHPPPGKKFNPVQHVDTQGKAFDHAVGFNPFRYRSRDTSGQAQYWISRCLHEVS